MTALARRLAAEIAQTGPITVAQAMSAALHDPQHGYYATRPSIGADGDFLTAPELSQMFGELVGLWCVQSWLDMDRPTSVQLIELGPGRGVLMADALRAARVVPAFGEAVRVVLVETSPPLRAVQAETLANLGVQPVWLDRLEDAPAGPALALGNEFLDCLPIRQFVRAGGAWRERLIGLDREDPARLAFGLGPPAPSAMIPSDWAGAPDGAIGELAPALPALVDTLAARFAAAPGRALFIDYGASTFSPGDTLQAVRRHAKVPVLETLGEADLTAHVDFAALRALGLAAGLDVAGPVEQGDWLEALGLGLRLEALSKARPDRTEALARAAHRLTGRDQMGSLFKVLALSTPGLPPPAGFA